MKGSILTGIVICLSAISVFAQENCSNGIDDDGDGFVDCYDDECAGSSDCSDFFFGDDGLCEVPPTAFPTFSIREEYGTPDRTATTMSRPTIGDVDGDGIPEIIGTNWIDKKIYVLNGNDGSIKYERTISEEPWFNNEVAIADIDRDGFAEIFIRTISSDRIKAYNYDLSTELWSTNVPGGEWLFSLADFDGDGLVELYAKNRIYDAHTGVLLADGGGTWDDLNSGSVAADILADTVCADCEGLELIEGLNIYSVDLGTRTPGAGSITKVDSRSEYFIKRRSLTSIADYNLDGHLDILANGATGAVNGYSTVFFWDVHNDVLDTYQDPTNNWGNGTGRLNISDMDNDGQLNVAYVSGEWLYNLNENLDRVWRVKIKEATSGFTSTTVFDFNGDGATEVVYRDEEFLYIVDGVTGAFLNAITCKSRTSLDYPVVADVDGDGATEICVSCNTDDATNIVTFNNAQHAQFRVYGSNGENWAPSRKVWNQSSYFNVNINEDLTIPIEQQKHHLVFSSGECTSGDNRPLNTFLNMAPFLDEDGCPVYSVPDLSYVDGSLTISDPICPETEFNVSFQIQNIGNITVNGSLPITFFDGDPTIAGATKLNTENVSISNLKSDSLYTINLTVNGPGDMFDLFVAINNFGNSIPLDPADAGILECDYDNNLAEGHVSPFPNTIFTEVLRDNIKCLDTIPNNGEARAFVLQGGAETTNGFTFNWHIGDEVTGTPDFVGAEYANLDSGFYTVYALSDVAGCSSDTATIFIDRDSESLDSLINITVDQEVTSCATPNGQLTADVNGTTAGYTFTWYVGNTVFDLSSYISVGPTASNLDATSYSVDVISNLTGCRGILTQDVPSNVSIPRVDIDSTQDVSDCVTPEGTILASVTLGIESGATAGYTFNWYNSDTIESVVDYDTNNLYTNLLPGDYTVQAILDSTGCESEPVTVSLLDNRNLPLIDSAWVVALNTVCDPALANGILSGSAEGGNIEPDFTFEWFSGNNTLPAQLTATGSTSDTGLEDGLYTMKVTEVATGCAADTTVTLGANTTLPVMTINKISDNTSCSTPNGELEGNVGGLQADYTFYWFNGIVGNPDTVDADFIGSNYAGLDNGFFTALVKDDLTGCLSDRRESEVEQSNEFSIRELVETNNQSCDASEPRGMLQVFLDDSANVEYDYIWIRGGAGSTDTIAVTDTSSYFGLFSGSYNVVVFDSVNGCSDRIQGSLNNDPFNMQVRNQDINSTSQTTCDPPNGTAWIEQVRRKGDPVPMEDLIFYLVDAAGDTIANQQGDSLFTGLTAGTYDLIVEHYLFKCQTTIKGAPTIVADTPTISVNVAMTDNTACNTALANGTGTATGATTGPFETFIYIWEEGNTFTGSGNLIDTAQTITGLTAGDYAVKAIGNTTGCQSANNNFGTVNDNPILPTLNLSDIDLTPATNCTLPGNGSVTINSIEESGLPQDTADYFYSLYDRNSALIEDSLSASITPLDSGTYFIEAISKISGCASGLVEIRINYNPTLPIANTGVINNSSCDPLDPNGIVFAQPTTDGISSAAGYTFNWNDPGSSTSDTVSNLDAGLYQVIVQDNANGCIDTANVTVNNNPLIPSLAAGNTTLVPQTSCSPFDGSFAINQVLEDGTPVNTTNFTFTFYQADGTTIIQDGNLASMDSLEAGDYYVSTTQQVGGCVSALLPFTVADNTINPTPNLSTIANTSCDTITAPNGQVISNPLTGGTAASAYSFEWFDGAGLTDAYTTTNDTLTAVAPGDVTIRLTDLDNNCSTIATVTVADNPLIPTIADADISISPQSFCDPANGSITVNQVTENGVGVDTANFIFTWYDAGANPIPGATTASLSGLDSGNYYVSAQSIELTCQSALNLVRVNYTSVRPQINPSVTDNSSCNTTYNGAIAVNPTTSGVPAAAGYAYEWFDGAGTSNPRPETTDSIGALAPGEYTIRITDQTNGCIRRTRVTVDSIPIIPVVASTLTSPQVNCTNPDGAIEITSVTENGIPADLSAFDYTLFDGTTFTQLASGTNPFINQAAGEYQVAVRDVTTDCRSARVNVTVDNNTVLPVANIAITPQTSCDTSLTTNGALVATGIGAGPFDYRWYDGDRPVANPASPAATGDTFTGLAQGIYTLRLTNTATQCRADTSVTVRDSITVPVLSFTTVGQDQCAPANGSIIASLSYGDSTNFTFTWYEGEFDDPSTIIAGENTQVLDNITAGTYTATAVNNLNHCEAVADTSIVSDNVQEVTFNLDAIIPALGACDDPTGELRVSATVPTPVAGQEFEFIWYNGEPPVQNVDSLQTDVVDPNEDAILSGRTGGAYTIIATNSENGCETDTTYRIPFQDDHEIRLVDIQGVRSCTTNDGFFSVTLDSLPISGQGSTLADYFYRLYEGSSVTSGTLIQDNISASTSDPTVFNNLGLGFYTIEAVQGFSPNCASLPLTVEINQETFNPIVTIDSSRSNFTNTFCVGGDGALAIEVSKRSADQVAAGTYTFNWYRDTINIANVLTATTDSIGGLRGNQYFVEVTDDVTGCVTNRKGIIADDPKDITVVTSLNSQTNCVAFNGEVVVNSVTENGLTMPDLTNYSFVLYDTTLTTIVDNTLAFDNLQAGTYFVRATDAISGCNSLAQQVVVQDETVIPHITFAQERSTTCDEVNAPNGSLFATVTPGAADGRFYDYEWYLGDFDFNDTIPGNNSDTLANIASGFYTLKATDDVSLCESFASVNLIRDPNQVIVEIADLLTTPQTFCFNNGEAEVTHIFIDSTEAPNVVGDFYYHWLDNSGARLNLTDSLNTIDSLFAGSYSVIAYQVSTNCESQEYDFDINDSITYPSVNFTTYANTACDPALRNGSIAADAFTGSQINTYGYRWYEGGIPITTASISAEDSVFDLLQGTYSIRVYDSLSRCSSTESVVLNKEELDFNILAMNLSPQDICAPVGAAEVTSLFYGADTLSSGFNNYRFTWTDASNAIFTTDSTFITDTLAAAIYGVSALHRPTNCVTDVFSFEIEDTSVDPVPALTVTDNTACDPALSNGEILASATTNGSTNTYTYQWYQGNLPLSSATNLGITDATLSDREVNTYSVFVTDQVTNCTAEASASISQDNRPFVVANALPVDQTFCLPNGEAEVQVVSYDNIDYNNPFGDFRFSWLNPGNNLRADTTFRITDLAPGRYQVAAFHFPTGCESDFVSVNIEETPVLPEANFVTYANTACVDGLANGSLVINASTPITGLVTTYDFEWSSNTTSTTPVGFVPTDSLSDLEDGLYSVNIRDNVTLCENTASVNLNLDEADSIFITQVAMTDQTVCSPAQGGANITELIDEGTIVSGGGLANYDFFLLDANLADLETASSPATSFSNYNTGIYFVQAVNLTNGCRSGRLQVTIEDNIPIIENEFNITPYTVCDTSLANGIITVSSTTNNVDNGYTYNWQTPLSGSTNTISGLAPGFYALEVTDLTTNCTFIDSVEMFNEIIDIRITDAGTLITDQTDVFPPNGAIEVDSLFEDGVVVNPFPGSYEFYFFDASDNPIDSLTLTVDSLAAGNYLIRARNTTTDCVSGATQVEVDYAVQTPTVVADISPNTACEDTLANGSIEAFVVNESGNLVTTGFTFTWYEGTQPIAASAPSIGSGNTLANVDAGRYSVIVSDIVSPNLGAVDTVTLTMYDSLTTPQIMTYLATDLDVCFPVGELEIISMLFGDTADYDFTWYTGEFIIDSIDDGETSAINSNLFAGNYFATATELSTGCVSDPLQMELQDNSVAPELFIADFEPNISCDPNNPDGIITMGAREMDGSGTITDYTFSWFNPDDLANASISANITGVSNEIHTNLGDTILTIQALSSITGCLGSYNVAMLDSIPNPLLLNLSASANTRCVDPGDGRVSANIIQPIRQLDQYTYYWFEGTGSLNEINNADYVATSLIDRVWENRSPGTYTVIAVDQIDPFCTSEALEVVVEDASSLPDISIKQNSPLTVCFDDAPNGQLTANVTGGNLGHSFAWVRGNSSSQDTISFGATASGLRDEQYSVIVTNRYSGCVNNESTVIETDFEPAPTPIAAITNEQTSCLNPNGSASVNVQGQALNLFTFNWYDASNNLISNGTTVGGLDEGTYTVSSILVSNGCESSTRDTFDIATEILLPEFEITATAATCEEFDARASIVTTNNTFVREVVWSDESGSMVGFTNGPVLNNLEGGFYNARVITNLGCENNEDFKVPTQVKIYNLVSANNDGLNDHFIINCIELFPESDVRLYNRAGALVYQTDGYNNADNFFNGVPNRSLSLGSQLADGTYYYVIDLGDGSELISGFIELVH